MRERLFERSLVVRAASTPVFLFGTPNKARANAEF